jgi:Holliday junction resolvase RusA-like endonuclease
MVSTDITVYYIEGPPIPLARARMCSHGIYDPQKNEKLLISLNLRSQHGNRELYAGPLHLNCTFFMGMPKHAKGKWPQLRGTYHKIKPDIDNLEKFLLDICNNIIIKDDCQIASVTKQKIYDYEPRTEFSFIPLTEKYGEKE